MFVGRERELAALEALWAEGEFRMAVVYGRRRVGKTALVTRFARGKRALYFTALEQSDANNLADLSARVRDFFSLPDMPGSFESWPAALSFLAERAREERFVFIFDELPYAAARCPSLPSALQVAIDRELSGTGMMLVLCGSDQGFMETRVLGRKSPLYGRRSAQVRVGPLGYLDARRMLPGVPAQEAFRYYGCLGGVPYYLEQARPEEGLRENLARLYFDPAGFLYGEPMGLLRQELMEPATYNSVLRALAGGANRPSEIADRTGVARTALPRYLGTLCRLGVIERAVPFGENPETSRRAIYRVSDACFAFWFRFVMPAAQDVESGLGRAVARALPDALVDQYLGLRFERLCAEWLADRARAGELPVPATSVGSWWGTDPATRSQTDVDVLAADRFGKRILLGECKYRNSIDETAVAEGLLAKAGLVKGYEAAGFYLFTKLPCSPATAAKLEGRVRCVSLDEMYGEP